MTVVESLTEYLGHFSGLENGRLNVDFLPAEATSYSVEIVSGQDVLEKYADGSSLRQMLFVLASRTFYGPELPQQIDNLEFFESFSEWLEARDFNEDYPDLGENRRAQEIGTTTHGYVFIPDTETARYQIQCRILYYQGIPT